VTAARDVVLRDGTTMRLRPPGREDEERLIAFLARLSDESRYDSARSFALEDLVAAVCCVGLRASTECSRVVDADGDRRCGR
jgi:hypothetical protein